MKCVRIYRIVPVVSMICLLLAAPMNSVSAEQKEHSEKAAPLPREVQGEIQRIEAETVNLSLGEGVPPLRLSLPVLMKVYNVPGFSIAVIRNFQIVWAKGYGVDAPEAGRAVTPKTLFQAASISKPVTAAAALALVEQGKLFLNEDVNRQLKSWKVPENEFTRERKVTLRELISHTSGLNVHGFRGYDTDEQRPTLLQALNGEKPANNPALRVGFVPGSQESYSGGGIEVEQLLMTDVTGQKFATLMRDIVLKKAGMNDSTFEQPLPVDIQSLAAAGTYADGKPVHGRSYVYVEQAAAGLWTTPTDLAKFAIEIAQSRNGRSNKILSQAMTVTMLTPWPEGGAHCFHMDRLNPGQFSHNGQNEGFEGQLNMNWKTGNGVVMMANSVDGEYLWDLVFRRVDKEYRWDYKYENPPRSLKLIAMVRGAQAALDRYTMLRKSRAQEEETQESSLNQIGYALLSSGRPEDALLIFKKNVQEHPNSSNAYDSLAETYMKLGQKDLAIQNYEKSLQLNAKNDNAREQLKQLRK